MKKLFPLLIAVMLLSGCVVEKGIEAVQPSSIENFLDDTAGVVSNASKKVFNPSTGYAFFLIALELNSNMSSLIIDKTKEKVVGYSSQAINKLTPGSFIFVIPPKISNGETYFYDDEMGRMIRNYLAAGKYGIPVSSPEYAEYIVVVNVRESLSKFYGLNYSEVAFSIMDKLDMPVFLASIRVESKSDRNFWYHATKKAKSVKQLTMKGLAEIMAKGLPEAHGEPATFLAKAEAYMKNGNKNNNINIAETEEK